MRHARLLAFVVAVTCGGLAACSSDDKLPFEHPQDVLPRLTTRVADVMPPDVDEPGSYRISFDRYTAATGADPDQNHATVQTANGKRQALNPLHLERRVTRPFDERIDGIDVVRRLGLLKDQAQTDARAVLLRPLIDDPRPRVYPLADPPVEIRKIAGRPCRFQIDASGSYCIDHAGLVLASDDGTTVDIATRVRVTPVPKTASAVTASLAEGFTDADLGSVRPIDPASSPPGVPDWSLAAPPEGFTFVGRYAVVPLSPELLQRNSRKVNAGVVDVYVRGKDSLVVDRGGRLDTSDVSDHDLGTLGDEQTVELGALGAGRSGIGGAGPFGYREVRAAPQQGRYVVVAGTLPLDQLVSIARSLRATPGTTITYLDSLTP